MVVVVGGRGGHGGRVGNDSGGVGVGAGVVVTGGDGSGVGGNAATVGGRTAQGTVRRWLVHCCTDHPVVLIVVCFIFS